MSTVILEKGGLELTLCPPDMQGGDTIVAPDSIIQASSAGSWWMVMCWRMRRSLYMSLTAMPGDIYI